MTKNKARYTVRQQSSGYAASVTYFVYDTKNKGRVTVNAHRTRESAQADADALNITDMVKNHADDPRPYAERLAEATKAFHARCSS